MIGNIGRMSIVDTTSVGIPVPPLLQVSEETRLSEAEAAKDAVKKAMEEREERRRLHQQMEARHLRRRQQEDIRKLETWPPGSQESKRKVSSA